MDVSAESAVALPTRLRPTPGQVCHWYEQNLRAMGAEVQQVAPGRLEFDPPLSQTLPLASLAPLTRGELEVSDTADGFEVSLAGKALLDHLAAGRRLRVRDRGSSRHIDAVLLGRGGVSPAGPRLAPDQGLASRP